MSSVVLQEFTAQPLDFRTIDLAEALKIVWFYGDKFLSLSLLAWM